MRDLSAGLINRLIYLISRLYRILMSLDMRCMSEQQYIALSFQVNPGVTIL